MFHDYAHERKFLELREKFGFKTVFETGTHLGHGTRHLGKYVERVVASDIDPQFFTATANALTDDGWNCVFSGRDMMEFRKEQHVVYLYNENSPDTIERLAPCLRVICRPFCFYLDAHWLEYWPLRDELKAIAEAHVPDSVIIIHDCKVPGKNFAFDSYGGQDLCYEYVADLLALINPNYKISYNDACDPKDEPYASARGVLYATP